MPCVKHSLALVPAAWVTSSNRISPRFRKSPHGSDETVLLANVPPPANSKSGRPSLSKSITPTPPPSDSMIANSPSERPELNSNCMPVVFISSNQTCCPYSSLVKFFFSDRSLSEAVGVASTRLMESFRPEFAVGFWHPTNRLTIKPNEKSKLTHSEKLLDFILTNTLPVFRYCSWITTMFCPGVTLKESVVEPSGQWTSRTTSPAANSAGHAK